MINYSPFSAESGKRQSPIDVDEAETEIDPALLPVSCSYGEGDGYRYDMAELVCLKEISMGL